MIRSVFEYKASRTWGECPVIKAIQNCKTSPERDRQTDREGGGGGGGLEERERETDKQIGRKRQTDRQRSGAERERQRQRGGGGLKERATNRQRQRKTERERESRADLKRCDAKRWKMPQTYRKVQRRPFTNKTNWPEGPRCPLDSQLQEMEAACVQSCGRHCASGPGSASCLLHSAAKDTQKGGWEFQGWMSCSQQSQQN